jgi:hypothetical protein
VEPSIDPESPDDTPGAASKSAPPLPLAPEGDPEELEEAPPLLDAPVRLELLRLASTPPRSTRSPEHRTAVES